MHCLGSRPPPRPRLAPGFLIDLVASLPYEQIVGDSRFRAFQLIKTVRLLRVRRLMRTWGFVAGANVLRVVFILCGWILVAHWYACAFYALGWVPLCGPTADTWLTEYWPEISRDDLCDDLVVGQGVGGEDLVGVPRRYVRSLYWALSTMSSMGVPSLPAPLCTPSPNSQHFRYRPTRAVHSASPVPFSPTTHPRCAGYGSAPVAVTDGEYVFAIWVQAGTCTAF